MKNVLPAAAAFFLIAFPVLAQGNAQPLPPPSSGSGSAASGKSYPRPVTAPAQATGSAVIQGTGGATPVLEGSAPPSNPTGGNQYQNTGNTAPK